MDTLDSLLKEAKRMEWSRSAFPDELWHLITLLIPSKEVLDLYKTAKEHGYVMVSQLAEDIIGGTQSFSVSVIECAMRNPEGICDELGDALPHSIAANEAKANFKRVYSAYRKAVENACCEINRVIENASSKGIGIYEFLHELESCLFFAITQILSNH